jgi:hypothetical protein
LTLLDLAFVVLVLALMRVARRWGPLYALLVWPGTVLHELAHWLVAALSGGRPTSLSVVPVRVERGWRLGSVAVARVRWFNALPIGCAPLLLAPVAGAAFVEATRVAAASPWHFALLYVATSAAASCLPSLADWRLVASKPFGSLAYVALAAAVWYALARERGWL